MEWLPLVFIGCFRISRFVSEFLVSFPNFSFCFRISRFVSELYMYCSKKKRIKQILGLDLSNFGVFIGVIVGSNVGSMVRSIIG